MCPSRHLREGRAHSTPPPPSGPCSPAPAQPASACSWGPGRAWPGGHRELWVGGEERREPPPRSLPCALPGMGSSLQRGGVCRKRALLAGGQPAAQGPPPPPQVPVPPCAVWPGQQEAWRWGRPRNGCEQSQPGSRAGRWQGRAGGVGVTLTCRGRGPRLSQPHAGEDASPAVRQVYCRLSLHSGPAFQRPAGQGRARQGPTVPTAALQSPPASHRAVGHAGTPWATEGLPGTVPCGHRGQWAW